MTRFLKEDRLLSNPNERMSLAEGSTVGAEVDGEGEDFEGGVVLEEEVEGVFVRIEIQSSCVKTTD